MTTKDNIKLKWKRPDSIKYPKIWHTFNARDLNSNELVEYRIQDLPASRVQDAYDHLLENYIKDVPMGQVYDAYNDSDFFEDYKFFWSSMISQKTPLVCFKFGSDEIIGINMIYVSSRGDNLMKTARKRFKSQNAKDIFDLVFLLFENYNTFEQYNVDEYLSSFGLSVSPKYRGRGIGNHFLSCRKVICQEFGLKLTQSVITSDFSNRSADGAGYELDVAIKYDDVIKSYPKFKKIAGIKSSQMTIKTLIVQPEKLKKSIISTAS